MKYLARMVMFLLVVLLSNYLINVGEAKQEKEDMHSEFNGVCVLKRYHRGNSVTIVTAQGKELKIVIASDALFENTNIGDTIMKKRDSNHCTVKKGEKVFVCDCYYFPVPFD